MSTKFSKRSFNSSQDRVEDDVVRKGFRGGTNEFIRSRKDNTLFKELQVENLKNIITEDCVNVIDSDSIAYKSASAVEEDYVEIVNLLEEDTEEEGLFVQTGTTFKNKTEFKGAARTVGKITQDSFLGNINVKREASGLTPYTLTDFEINPKKRLKYEDGVEIDGLKFENSLEVLKYFMDGWIDAIKKQTQVENVLLVLGEGETHRHSLLLPKRYKEARVDLERPILLKEARTHLLEEYPSEMAPEGYEADERVDAYGYRGYQNYRKTGKFNFIKSSIDKDAMNLAGYLFNYTKDFHFKYPQGWLIETSDKDVGRLELVKNKVKGTGLKFLCYQIVISDSADGYGSRLTMPKEMKEGISYGDTNFYKDFLNLNTPQEILSRVVELFAEWFPYGLQYTAWDGTEVDEDTLSWLEKCFSCAYMKLSLNDSTTFTKIMKAYKVAYSCLEGNNRKTKPVPVFNVEGAEKIIEDSENTIMTLLENQCTAYKSLKKGDLVKRMDVITEVLKDTLKYIQDNKTIMVQEEKQQ